MSEGPGLGKAICLRRWPQTQPPRLRWGRAVKKHPSGEQWGRGARDLFATEAESESWARFPRCACLSLPDLIESPRRLSGDVGLVHTGGAHSKGAVLRVHSSTSLSWRWAAVESEAGLFQPSSSPFLGRVRPVHTPLVCDRG